jgi:hypothetical protein
MKKQFKKHFCLNNSIKGSFKKQKTKQNKTKKTFVCP